MKYLTLVNVSKGFADGLMPLGLLSISAYIKKNDPEIEIKLLDSNCQDLYENFETPDVIGISAVTQDIGRAIHFAEFIRSKNTTPIILGGVHISTYLKLPKQFDVGVIGEGEQTMLELIQLEDFSHKNLKNIKGICYNNNNNSDRTIFTDPRDLITNLDDIPIVDRDLTNISYYSQPRQIIPYHFGRSFTMISSRGCPFNCVFCSTKIHWKKFRAFSAKRVIEEIELLINRYNAEIIHIFDDLFIADKRRLKEIHRYIVEKKINEKVKFMCLVRSDMIDDEIMKLLKEMNVVVIGIGMESGSESMLAYLKRKTTTIENNIHAIELSNKYKIPTMGSFMVGNPNETEEELLETLNFIKSYRNSPFLCPLTYISTAFPGTEFWNFALEKGIPVENFDKIVMDIPHNINDLKDAPLLTRIPLDRFFEIICKFDKETQYGMLKRNTFFPKNAYSIVKAYREGAIIEKNLFVGFIEVTKLLFMGMNYKINLFSK
ncbi:MAG: radical SAM protein [Methanoregula sp.]|nr:radical SAM protein [Methanoregula sp.]